MAGASFIGSVDANVRANDRLVLANDGTGTLAGFGTTITGFATIAEQAGAHWELGGTLAGAGVLQLGTLARLVLDGGSSLAGIQFLAGGGETLVLDQPAMVTSTLSGFAASDTITLAGQHVASLSYNHCSLSLFNQAHALLETLHFAGDNTAADFSLQQDGRGTDLLYGAPPEATHVIAATLLVQRA